MKHKKMRVKCVYNLHSQPPWSQQCSAQRFLRGLRMQRRDMTVSGPAGRAEMPSEATSPVHAFAVKIFVAKVFAAVAGAAAVSSTSSLGGPGYYGCPYGYYGPYCYPPAYAPPGGGISLSVPFH